MSFWQFAGQDFVTAAIDWMPLATVPIQTLPGATLTAGVQGEVSGAPVDFKITIDGEDVHLGPGISLSGVTTFVFGERHHHNDPFIVKDATFRVPTRTPLMELASYDTPTKVKFWVRTTRQSEIRRWKITIHPALSG